MCEAAHARAAARRVGWAKQRTHQTVMSAFPPGLIILTISSTAILRLASELI